jgi:anti-sigma regulatory factor (Ser/Thr protein kinase)
MLKIAATIDNLPTMLTAVRDFLTKHEVLSEFREKITLATEEIVVNIIAYAYPETPGDVEIRWHITPDKKLIIEITDWGIPFDPRHVPEPNIDLPLENLKTGGLGIWIVQNLTDELQYRRESGKNILTLVFGLP